jgi:glyoxylase-like metal-dependent hydrolase (beta-lactamase superfamily II)
MANAALALPAGMHVFERGWLSANNILFIGEDTALIDSGYVTHAAQTCALVAHALGARPLDRLVNTHLHSDHCGGNAALQARFGCRTSIPAAEADAVRAWDLARLSFIPTGQQCARFSFDATIAPGDTLRLGQLDWHVLGAPGHDAHAVMLYCPAERILISGDALWENGFGVVFPELVGEPGFGQVRATLDLIAARDVRLVIPGHGRPFTDVEAALARAYARIDYLAADSARNAQYGIKVLLKFLLLERRRIALTELPQLLQDIPLVRRANREHLRLDADGLASWAVAQLVRAQAATVRDGYLCECTS